MEEGKGMVHRMSGWYRAWGALKNVLYNRMLSRVEILFHFVN